MNWTRRLNHDFWNIHTIQSITLVSVFTFTLVGPVYVVTSGKAAALILTKGAFIYIVTLVFASNVHEVEAFMTFADVTPKSVDTLPESGAGGSSGGTFINIHTGPPIRSQLQARRGALAPNLPLDNITAILTVCHGARQGTRAGPVRQEHVPAQTVALVAAVRVHAPVLAGPWLQATLVQVLIAGFPSISRMTLALVRSHTFTMFALWLAYRLTLSPGPAGPAPAAVNPPTITTQAN